MKQSRPARQSSSWRTPIILLVVSVFVSLIAIWLIRPNTPSTHQTNIIPSQIQTTPTERRSPATTTLLFLGNQNIAPVVYLNGTTTAGLAVDIVHALAAYIPQPTEIRAMDWPTAQTLVAQGKADALIQINQTAERNKIYDFSDPLLESHFSIFTNSDRVGLSDVPSLEGLRVGIESGGLPQQLLGKDPKIILTVIPNFLEGFKQIQARSIDAVVVDYRVGSYLLAENNIPGIKVAGNPISPSYSSIAVKKGNTELLTEINQALQTIKADGTYQNILDRWKPTEVVFQTQGQISQEIFYVIILVLLVLILITLTWTFFLRRELIKRRAAEEELKELDRLKDDFLSVTTHELKNPLVPIKSQSQLLLAGDYGELTPEQKDAVEMIHRNEEALSKLAGEIHDIAKIQSGKLLLLMEPTAFDNIITDVVHGLNGMARQKHLSLSPIPKLPKLQIDGPRIRQVISNLLDNAIKFTPKNGRIDVDVKKTSMEIIVVVKDSGIGLSKQNLAKLFTPFFQVDSSIVRKFRGTGLGLAVSKGIIEAHGGKIWAESDGEGKGSAFVFSLPVG